MLASWYHLLAASSAGSFVVWNIPHIIAIAHKYKKFDVPCARKVHQKPIARLGGISIAGGTLLALLLVWILGATQSLPPESVSKLLWVMIGGSAFFGIGLLDDFVGLSAILRLLMQIAVSSWVWWAGVQIDFVSLPAIGIVHLGWLSLPVTVLWLAGVVNAINWIDGLDGLASGVSCIAAVAIFVVCLFTGQCGVALLMMALTGSLVGFLYYNFNPARIFMGDGGSYFIGFVIAGASVVGLVKSAAITAILLPFLVLAVPILDMSAVIIARLRDGKSPFAADRRHLHHRLLKIGLPHRFTVLFIYAMALWAGSWAIALVGIPNSQVLVIGTTGLLGCAIWRAWQLAVNNRVEA